jgi:hypothetical protein
MLGQGTRSNRAIPQPKITYATASKWDKGVYSRVDADRTPLDGLRVTENVQLSQDGVIEPRPGLRLYGTQPTGTVLGAVYEFVKMNGSTPETWLMCMQVIGGVGTVCINKDGGAWTQITGKTYSATAKAHFEQVYGKVIISNGSDNLSYYDIAVGTITPFTALTQPSAAPTVAATGLTGTNATYRYKYTFSNLGETAASPAQSQVVLKLREQWDGTTQFVTISGTCPSGTPRVILYVGTAAGSEFFLDTVEIPSGATTWTYTDTGSIAENPNRIAPVGDSTAGPKVTRTSNIKGQLYMVGDSDNPGRIWFGGAGTYSLDFSSYNGGGWVEPNKGGKDFPVVVKPFRDGKGTPMAVCFSKGTNGAGKRYLLSPATTTLGTTTISYMSVQEDNGQEGTDSPDGVVLTNDGAWYPSRSGFKTSNTKANIQNIISTSGISDNIAPDVAALSSKYMDSCIGLVNDQRIYWALPYLSTTNNQMNVLDLRQNGAWVRPWYISVDWMTLYADNTDGKTKFLVLSNNKLYEFDTAANTNDNGVAFTTNVTSGSVKVGKNGESANVRYVKFIFLRPQGKINLSVTVNTEDGPQTFSDTLNETANQAVSAWGSYGWGGAGWGNLAPVAADHTISAARERVVKIIEIDEECDYYSWTVNSVDAGVSYQLAEVTDSKVMIGVKDVDAED